MEKMLVNVFAESFEQFGPEQKLKSRVEPLILTKYWENNYIDLDKDTVAGDLLIVDGYRISHCIGPVNVNDNQEGRITIFLPGNPGKIRDSLKSFKDFL